MSQISPGLRSARRAFAATALACAGFTLAGGLAVAQEPEEIIVTAPRAVHEQIGRSPSTGAPIERITLTRHVSYADLDLAKTADADELKTRVGDMAKKACKQLDSLYPLLPSDPACVRSATDGAMEQVTQAIAAATK